MITINKFLPGELEGTIDAGDYGFDVITEDVESKEERAVRVGLLYRRAKERTGVVIPALEPYLEAAATVGAPHGVDDEIQSERSE